MLAGLAFAGSGAAPAAGRREAAWGARLARKQRCLAAGAGGFYLYHARKAAGTTLRAALQEAARRHRVAYWETEGLSIDPMFLGLRSIITVVSVRDPIRRVLSMYWYEHVGWHDGILHDPAGLRTLRAWVDEWKDDSPWKRDFARRNPGNVYVEVQNYFTKALAGWNAAGAAAAVDAAALSRARAALERFDAIFVVERATWPNHTALLRRALGHDAPLRATLRGAGPRATSSLFSLCARATRTRRRAQATTRRGGALRPGSRPTPPPSSRTSRRSTVSTATSTATRSRSTTRARRTRSASRGAMAVRRRARTRRAGSSGRRRAFSARAGTNTGDHNGPRAPPRGLPWVRVVSVWGVMVSVWRPLGGRSKRLVSVYVPL